MMDRHGHARCAGPWEGLPGALSGVVSAAGFVGEFDGGSDGPFAERSAGRGGSLPEPGWPDSVSSVWLDDGHARRAELEEFLAALAYPVSREEIVAQARAEGAPVEILDLLERLAAVRFGSPADVAAAIDEAGWGA